MKNNLQRLAIMQLEVCLEIVKELEERTVKLLHAAAMEEDPRNTPGIYLETFRNAVNLTNHLRELL